MKPSYTFEQIQSHLDSLGAIKISDISSPRYFEIEKALQKGIKEFVFQFINYGGVVTINPDGSIDHFLRRSIGDLYRISKFYFPDVSFKDIFNCLSELASEKKLRSYICADIGKRVYRDAHYECYANFNSVATDEFGIDWSHLDNIESRNCGGYGIDLVESNIKFEYF